MYSIFVSKTVKGRKLFERLPQAQLHGMDKVFIPPSHGSVDIFSLNVELCSSSMPIFRRDNVFDLLL